MLNMDNNKAGLKESESVNLEIKEKPRKPELKSKSIGAIREKFRSLIIKAAKAEKLKNLTVPRSPSLPERLKSWKVGVTVVVLVLWVCVMHFTAFGEFRGPANLKLDSFFSPHPSSRAYENKGYLLVSTNGGLNQMRTGICDMVTIARFLNVTLVIPKLDSTSFWHDNSEFEDVFNVDYFINSLSDEVRIVVEQELPYNLRKKLQQNLVFSMPPISWSNMSYYYAVVSHRIDTYEIIHFSKTDSRLANNEIPEEVQKMRCRVNYKALRFTPAIEAMGKKLVNILRQKGPFLVLHLRYEMDMLAFSGCTEGCNNTEVKELTEMRYAYPWWKEKEIDSDKKRSSGLCPLTPEETALVLKAFDIDPSIQVYIAAGDIYGGEKRLGGLRAVYPNLVKKETILPPSDLEPFKNHSNQMAALDYLVSIQSDIFVPTYGGNMANAVQGHRRYLGFKITINLDHQILVRLIDQYKKGKLSWENFSQSVKTAHANRMGGPIQRFKLPGKPKEEEYFYANPEECLPPLSTPSKSKRS